jgi:hypothetical protein
MTSLADFARAFEAYVRRTRGVIYRSEQPQTQANRHRIDDPTCDLRRKSPGNAFAAFDRLTKPKKTLLASKIAPCGAYNKDNKRDGRRASQNAPGQAAEASRPI